MSNSNAKDMNTVNSIKRNFSFEYRYEVIGCIFTISQTMNGSWVMTGYSSLEDEANYGETQEWVMDKKKHCIQFLKYTFNREDWGM